MIFWGWRSTNGSPMNPERVWQGVAWAIVSTRAGLLGALMGVRLCCCLHKKSTRKVLFLCRQQPRAVGVVLGYQTLAAFLATSVACLVTAAKLA